MTKDDKPHLRKAGRTPLLPLAIGCGLSLVAVAAVPAMFSVSAAISADTRYRTNTTVSLDEFSSEDPVPLGTMVIIR